MNYEVGEIYEYRSDIREDFKGDTFVEICSKGKSFLGNWNENWVFIKPLENRKYTFPKTGAYLNLDRIDARKFRKCVEVHVEPQGTRMV